MTAFLLLVAFVLYFLAGLGYTVVGDHGRLSKLDILFLSAFWFPCLIFVGLQTVRDYLKDRKWV